MVIFTPTNPLQQTTNEAEQLLAQLHSASEELQDAIAAERQYYSAMKDAEINYQMAEDECLTEIILQATLAKSGPLAGLAVSGDGYKIALNNLRGQLRQGKLAGQWDSLCQVRRNYEDAHARLMQAEIRFKEYTKAIDIKAQILHASML